MSGSQGGFQPARLLVAPDLSDPPGGNGDAEAIGRILSEGGLVGDVQPFEEGFSDFAKNPAPLREFLQA